MLELETTHAEDTYRKKKYGGRIGTKKEESVWRGSRDLQEKKMYRFRTRKRKRKSM